MIDDKYFENDLYWKEHINRQLSIDMWIDEYKNYFNNKGICLELGCGIGQYSKRLIEYGYKVISTDISDIALNEVKKFNQNVEKVDMSMPLRYDNNSFDLVFSSLAIHYFSEEKTAQLMSEIHRVLKNGGLFVGSVNGLEGYDVIKDTAIRLEENFYFNKGKYIHLFDDKELNKYFKDYQILKIEKREVERFGHKKNYWIFIVKKD